MYLSILSSFLLSVLAQDEGGEAGQARKLDEYGDAANDLVGFSFFSSFLFFSLFVRPYSFISFQPKKKKRSTYHVLTAK